MRDTIEIIHCGLGLGTIEIVQKKDQCIFKRRKQYEEETGAFTNLVDILIFRNKKTVMEEVFCRIVCMLSKYVDGANIVTIFSSQYFSFDI